MCLTAYFNGTVKPETLASGNFDEFGKFYDSNHVEYTRKSQFTEDKSKRHENNKG